MTGLRLWSGGVPLDDLGPVGDDLLIATVFGDGGCGVDQITWSMGLPRGFTHPALKQGAVVELRRGPLVVATVINDEPDVDAWKFSAKGLIHRAADFIAVNSAGTPTNMLADAVNAAVANGLEWKVPTDLANAAVSIDSVDQVLTVADLLNRYCAQTSQRWGITGSGWLRFYTDPTSPRWVLTPDAPSLASARGQVSRLRVRYATSVDESGSPATLATVVVPAAAVGQKGVVESFQDITNYGALTAPQATTIATDILRQQAPQQAFTSGITPGPGQLTNIGDVPMDGGLWLVALDVAEGAMVRSQGWRNPDVGVSGMGFDWIAGGATWSKPSGITITPLAMAATVFSDNMAEIRAGVQAAQSAASTALAVGSPDYLQSLITEDSDTTSSSTMPTTAQMGDLWLNNPDAYICITAYSSSGTIANWAKVTDPRTIALMRTHATAFLKADAAATDATVALTAANGKNKITGATRIPTSSDPGVEGDTWDYFVGGNISAVYTYTSGVWTIRKIRDEVIDTLTVGKVVGIDAAFLNAHIDYLTSVDITSGTLTGTTLSSGTGQHVEIVSDEIHLYSGAGSEITYGSVGTVAYGGGARADLYLIPPHMSSGSTTSSLALSDDGHGKFTGTDFSISGTLLVPNSPTTTTSNAANAFISTPSGAVFLISGSSRAIKYDIEPADIDDDIAALERCGVFAYHYRTDPTARLIIGVIVEDMMEQGLRRYVDFDENDEPLQPSWNQISALLIAAHQRNARRLSSLEARLTALEAS